MKGSKQKIVSNFREGSSEINNSGFLFSFIQLPLKQCTVFDILPFFISISKLAIVVEIFKISPRSILLICNRIWTRSSQVPIWKCTVCCQVWAFERMIFTVKSDCKNGIVEFYHLQDFHIKWVHFTNTIEGCFFSPSVLSCRTKWGSRRCAELFIPVYQHWENRYTCFVGQIGTSFTLWWHT